VSRNHVEPQLLDQPCQAGRLAFGQVEHQASQCRCVDDRMRKRALQPAPHEPGVEGVVAVLDEDRTVRKPKKRTAGVLELRGSYEHRTVDVMPLFRVGVDRGAAVDQCVEEGQRAGQPETLGTHLEHQKRRISGGLDVQGHELRLFERGQLIDLGSVDGDLLPRHRLRRAAWLEEHGLFPIFRAHRVVASARRAQLISSLVIPRSSRTATA